MRTQLTTTLKRLRDCEPETALECSCLQNVPGLVLLGGILGNLCSARSSQGCLSAPQRGPDLSSQGPPHTPCLPREKCNLLPNPISVLSLVLIKN